MWRSTNSEVDWTVYVVTDPALGSALLPQLRGALRGGASVVQFRDKAWRPREHGRTEVARAVRALTRDQSLVGGRRVPFIVNDHVELALEVDADGLHIGRGDIDPERARARIGEHRLLGYSVRNMGELAGGDPEVDYLGVGPIYPTRSKPDAAPPIGTQALRSIVRAAPRRMPIVAIGGIRHDNAEEVFRCGVDGVAVISAVLRSADPRGAATQLRAASGRRRVERGISCDAP